MKKRLFVAIPLPGGLVREFVSHFQMLDADGVRWTKEENFHITLHFIGYVEEERVGEISEKITDVTNGRPAFRLAFDSFEFAPPKKQPRMIWAVFRDESGEYGKLAEGVAGALFNVSESAQREPIPHATIARFKQPDTAKDIRLENPKLTEDSFLVSSALLMESSLLRSGPTYNVLCEYRLSQ